MVETRQNAPLNEDFFNAALIDKLVDHHLLEGIELLTASHSLRHSALQFILMKLDLEDGSICPVSNSATLSKIRPCQCFALYPCAFSGLSQVCLAPLLQGVATLRRA